MNSEVSASPTLYFQFLNTHETAINIGATSYQSLLSGLP